MRVLIVGATGVLGRRLVAELSVRGHDVVGLTRNGRGDATVSERGGTPVRGDIFDRESLLEAAAGADVVVHAATAIPVAPRPSPADWERNDAIRRTGTRTLVAVADAVGAERYLQQSVTWVARRSNGGTFDESSPPRPDRVTWSAVAGEDIARTAAEMADLDVGILRCGSFYGPDATHTRSIGRRLLARRMPIIGGGVLGRRDGIQSYLHVADAARAFADAAESDATGTWHVVDDRPVPFATFLRAFADRLDAPAPLRVPGWLAEPLVGEDLVRTLTSSAPTSNESFRDAVGWQPRYATVEDGLDDVVETWRTEGRLRRIDGEYRLTVSG